MANGNTAIIVIISILALGCAGAALFFALKNKIKNKGPQGPQGPPGKNGKDGKDGTNGKDGTCPTTCTESTFYLTDIPSLSGVYLEGLNMNSTSWEKYSQLPSKRPVIPVPGEFTLNSNQESSNITITMYVGGLISAFASTHPNFYCFLAPVSNSQPNLNKRLGAWYGTPALLSSQTVLQWNCGQDGSTLPYPTPQPSVPTDKTKWSLSSFPVSKTIPTEPLYLWYSGDYGNGYSHDNQLYANIFFTLSSPLTYKKNS